MAKNSRKMRKYPIVVLAVIILLVFFHYINILRPVENILIKIFSPIERGLYVAGSKIKNFYKNQAECKNYLTENKILKEQIQKLTMENSELKIYKDENESLRRLMGFFEDFKHQYLISRIIARDPVNPNIFILNKGENDNIKAGMPVIADQGFVVGKIIEVNKSNSKFLLLTDNLSAIAATIQNNDKTIGVVEGEYGLSIKMNFIPLNEEVKEGDIVVASGLEAMIPKGLIIGRIEKIEMSEDDLFRKAYISSMVDLEKIDIVTVLTE